MSDTLQKKKEVIVLIQHTLGAGYDNNGFWDMTVISLGMVFCATGEVNIRERAGWNGPSPRKKK